jgi:peroxiredoxin Q/BCP
MQLGDAMPDVTATDTHGAPLALRALPAPIVIWFYPRDDTSGCTREAVDFTAMAGAFADAGVALLGISRDDPASHAKFAAKHGLAVPLASDLDGSVTEAFGVWVEKQMYGRRSMGIERSTFLFGADRTLRAVWRKVRVPGHVEAVLAAARAR